MSRSALRIAIVGHTNTGKTSLVRTLTHDRRFGEVRDEGGTTREILACDLVADGGHRIELFDSPGLENAPELLDWIDRQPQSRHDGPARIRGLIEDPAAARQFDHEMRVLELMLDIDVALYVIDAREPILEKYQDELAVLGLCARPIVAVLNFTAAPESREAEWRDALARVQLHTVLSFDAAVRDPATELALFEKLMSQLDTHREVLSAWLDHRRNEEVQRRRAGLEAIAALLVDAAGCRREVSLGEPVEKEKAWREMREAIRRREQACVDTLLELYRFGREDYEDDELPAGEEGWQADPFDPESLRHYGIKASGYAAVGAGAGAAVDIGTGGLSLGTGTLAGAAIGAGAGLLRSAGAGVIDRMRGLVRLQVDDAVLRLLMVRNLHLLGSLIRRGHGNPRAIRQRLDERAAPRLPRIVRRSRHHPRWSAINHSSRTASSRQAAIIELAEALEPLESELQEDPGSG